MLPPSKDIANKILREKAIKFKVPITQVDYLIKKGDLRSLNILIDAAYKRKIKAMDNRIPKMFKDLGKELERQTSIPQKKVIQIERQNHDLEPIKDYLREELNKLNKRGPPKSLSRSNKGLTEKEILKIIENANKKFKKQFDKNPTLPRELSSNRSVKSNDSGYDADKEKSYEKKKKKKQRKKQRKKTKKKKGSKKRSRR